jgi:formylglycine-generating enzyme required for sulfatase activity
MLVPDGPFVMGSDSAEPAAAPAHRVTLRAYYIDKFEITLGQYKRFLDQRRLEQNPYRDLSAAALRKATSDRHPVVGVAWRDAKAYAQWSGKSLPTEAQWEKAARGTDGRRFPWGEGAAVWEKPRTTQQIDPIGTFQWDISVYGCRDMAANAWEWCADWYDPDFYEYSPDDDPEGPETWTPSVTHTDPERVLRGGSATGDISWRAPGGINAEPGQAGFRCVLNLVTEALDVAASDAGPEPPATGTAARVTGTGPSGAGPNRPGRGARSNTPGSSRRPANPVTEPPRPNPPPGGVRF